MKIIKSLILVSLVLTFLNIKPQQLNLQVLSASTQTNIVASIDGLLKLFMETLSPKLKDIISKEDAQKLNNLLEEIKKTDWKKYYESLQKFQSMKNGIKKDAIVEEYRQKMNELDQLEESELKKLDEKYPMVVYALSLSKEDFEMCAFSPFKKRITVPKPSLDIVKISDFDLYFTQEKAIYDKFDVQKTALLNERTTKYKLLKRQRPEEEFNIEIAKPEILMNDITALLTKYSDKISIDRNFWFNFLQQLLAQLAPTLNQMLIQELEITIPSGKK